MLRDVVEGDFLARSAPDGARALKDVAFAGNGEPTTSPDFAASVEVVGRVLEDVGLAGKIPVVLITNGTQAKKASVAKGIERLAAIGGVVWFKLDTATSEGMERIHQAPGEPAAHLQKLRAVAALCPTWIQTCMFAWDGAPPSEAEQEAYLQAIREIVRDRVPVLGVLLYSVARASMQPESERVSQLDVAWLRAFAAKIEAAGLPVKVTA